MATKYPYRTGARLRMIPAALVVAVIVGLFVKWDAGLLAGLGLSIAESLTRVQGGTFEIRIDGDLFKALVTFPLKEEEEHKALAREIKKNDRRNRRRADLNDEGFVPINIING